MHREIRATVPAAAGPLLAAILPCLLVAFGALAVVPHFRGIYALMGLELPWPTRWLLATFHGWGLSAAIPVAAWMLRGRYGNRDVVALLAGVATAALLFCFGIMACYAPIYMLNRLVG